MSEEVEVDVQFEVAKLAPKEGRVFGWASVIEKDGKELTDLEGDVIDSEVLEKAAYDFVLNAGVASAVHKNANGTERVEKVQQVGRPIESMYFSKEKQEALGIDLKKVGWWIGFQIDDAEVRKKVESGEFPMFSIGGKGVREPID